MPATSAGMTVMWGKHMHISLDGRVALITGGSKGLGLAMATRFAASGADVAIVARGAEDLAKACAAIGKTAKGAVETFAGDVARSDDIARVHGEAVARFGRI